MLPKLIQANAASRRGPDFRGSGAGGFLMRKVSAYLLSFLAAIFGTSASAQQVANAEVRAFLQGQPIHGNDYNEVLEVSRLADQGELVELLSRETEEAYWTQAVALLSVADNQRVVDALIAFVEKKGPGDQPLSRAHHDARSAAITGLGYLANRTGSDRALSYLIEGLTPGIWRERGVEGFAPWMNSYAESDRLLSTYALFGLAFSGHPRAGQALKALRDSSTDQQAQFRDGLDDTLTQWLEVHTLVAERGIVGMYDHYETQRQLQAER